MKKCFLQGGKVFLVFSLDSGLVHKKVHYFVQYTPMKNINEFVQSPVIARRQRRRDFDY